MEHIYSSAVDTYFKTTMPNDTLKDYGGIGYASWDTTAHRHNDYYEITLIIAGVYLHIHNGITQNLTPGHLLLMSPSSTHQLYTEHMQATYFAICIHEKHFEKFLKQYFPEFTSFFLAECTSLLLDEDDFTYLKTLCRQLSSPNSPRYIADIITYLTLVNIFHKRKNPKASISAEVQCILNILNEPSNLQTPICQLYSAQALSTASLIKHFKEQTGYTIVEYRNKKRMELATEMLKNTNKKIITIASELYYDSISHFLRVFKKEYGITPTEYREKFKNSRQV